MRPITVSLALLLVLGVVLANPAISDYMYAGENQTGSDAFTAFDSTYEIIIIDGHESLMIKDGELISDESEIEAALYQHYVAQYYPDEEQISNLTAYLELYHASRENGDLWKDVEEEECRMGIFLHAFPCTNDTIPTNFQEGKANDCYLTASVLCEEYGDYLGCSDPVMIMPLLQDFALSSNGMTAIQEDVAEELANVTEGNIYDVLMELQADIETMRAYEEKLETTKLRVPNMAAGDECRDCHGICPPIVIDEEHLDAAEDLVDDLLEEVHYIGEYEELAVQIHDETIERTEYKQLNDQRAEYTAIYEPEKNRAVFILQDADELLEYVSDDTVITNSERVEQVMDTISTDLDNSNFATMEANLDELNAKLNVLTDSIESSWQIYNKTVAAKERTDAIFFTLDTKHLSEDDAAEVAILKSDKRTQDRSFVDGLSPAKYTEIKESYVELGDEAATLLSSVQDSEVVVDTFKGAGEKTNAGIADLASTMAPLERTQKEEFSEYTPILVSSLSFFSISSLAVFIFLFAFATFNRVFKNKMLLFFGILALGCSILFAGVLSGGIYYVLSSSSTDASFTDFQTYVAESNHVSILVNSEGVPAGASSQMMACAEQLADSLGSKDVIIYDKTSSECIVNGEDVTLAECYNTVEEPIIMFEYTTVEQSSQFNTGFVYKGTFYGDEEYFSECQVAQGFTQTDLDFALEAPAPELNETGTNSTEETA